MNRFFLLKFSIALHRNCYVHTRFHSVSSKMVPPSNCRCATKTVWQRINNFAITTGHCWRIKTKRDYTCCPAVISGCQTVKNCRNIIERLSHRCVRTSVWPTWIRMRLRVSVYCRRTTTNIVELCGFLFFLQTIAEWAMDDTILERWTLHKVESLAKSGTFNIRTNTFSRRLYFHKCRMPKIFVEMPMRKNRIRGATQWTIPFAGNGVTYHFVVSSIFFLNFQINYFCFSF